MPMGSDHVCLMGKTGSHRRRVKVMRLTRIGHSPLNHRQFGSGGGDGLQRCLNPSSRPCANPRRDERGLPAETTELCCGHTCRMPPVCGRRPSPMLPSLPLGVQAEAKEADRKSTRLNSSHLGISYAVFCLKKKKVNVVEDASRTDNSRT